MVNTSASTIKSESFLPDIVCLTDNVKKSGTKLKWDETGFHQIVAPVILPNCNKFSLSRPSHQQDWPHIIVQVHTDAIPSQSETFQSISYQLQYAHANGAFGVYIKCPFNRHHIQKLAQALLLKIRQSFKPFVFIELPVCSIVSADSVHDPAVITDPWLAWTELRSLLPIDHRVYVSMELTLDHLNTRQEQLRWFGEPVYFVKLTESVLAKDSKNTPVLSQTHLEFLYGLVNRRNFNFLVDENVLRKFPQPILLSYLQNTLTPDIQQYAPCSGYWLDTFDSLYNPLQPLKENLVVETYQDFERDKIKYKSYSRAIFAAMVDKIEDSFGAHRQFYSSSSLESNSMDSLPDLEDSDTDSGVVCRLQGGDNRLNTYPQEKPLYGKWGEAYNRPWINYITAPQTKEQVAEEKARKTSLVVLVVGAGRGPLVKSTLLAAEKAKLKRVTIYAVEKNPLAQSDLLSNIEEWQKEYPFSDLHWYFGDMRSFTPPVKADLVVSELLGSFGCNELSPECLDGVCNALKSDAICIPQSYSSHIEPIMSWTLYTRVESQKKANKTHPFECHYVVNLRNYFAPCTSKKVFEFSHYQPAIKKTASDANYRSKSLKFKNEIDFLLHGFAGYFSVKLYGQFGLSIRPSDHTQDLTSWFPLFFPLKTPIFIPAHQGLRIHMTRRATNESVWYELSVASPVDKWLIIEQNKDGHAHPISLKINTENACEGKTYSLVNSYTRKAKATINI